jgi:hypothetical protein
MPFTSETATGRPKGAENKETKKLREAISAITEGGVEDFQRALNEVLEDNPSKYLELYLKLLEYTMPKLRSVDTNLGISDEAIGGIKIEVVNKANESRTNNTGE